ncbi:epoxide hydrolase [Dendryphion nanum]|uniref:Epoxide hydrolase n=1 Tax=Dendryphion nanum TaxID=256645 RepID=A0A9P9IW95_9PLEO|nr:epoxide hydrolase [Dendryphion nanum]
MRFAFLPTGVLLLASGLLPNMAQALPPKRSLSIPEGPRYSYLYSEARPSKPTFLLLHGFPSTANEWRKQFVDLSAAGYGVVVPDLLGFGDTDKPVEVEAYAFSNISSHVTKILDHEGLQNVIGVGHDWGSVLLGRVYNYYPQYFSALAFLSVPYTPPAPFDLDAINEQTKQAFGYETFGYMYFFNETDAAATISLHPESFFSLIYPENSEIQKTELCPRGKIAEWLRDDRRTPLPSYESQSDRDARLQQFASGGWVGPTNWYKSAVRNIDSDAVAQIPLENYAIAKPVVFAGGDIDFVTRPELMAMIAGQAKQEGWLPNVEFKSVQGGSHWLILEQPQQVLAILEDLAAKL